MKFVRVTCEGTTCEECYLGEDREKAEARFRKEHPSLDGLKVTTQIVDNEDEKWKDYFRILREQCGWSIW